MDEYFDWEWIKGHYFEPWLRRAPPAQTLEDAWKAGFEAGASEFGSDQVFKEEK